MLNDHFHIVTHANEMAWTPQRLLTNELHSTSLSIPLSISKEIQTNGFDFNFSFSLEAFYDYFIRNERKVSFLCPQRIAVFPKKNQLSDCFKMKFICFPETDKRNTTFAAAKMSFRNSTTLNIKK